ncbi:F-box/WD repeat-containing protein 7-like isoform X2 [Dysidea avara]
MDTSVQVDGRTGQSSSSVMDDNTDVETSVNNSVAENNVTSSKMTPKTSTPSKGKRPKHVAELPSPRMQNSTNLTESGPEISVVISEELTEPENKKRRSLQQTWCNQQFVVSKLEGHNDVVCCLDCNQQMLLTGSRDTSVKLWSLTTFEMLHHMGGHTGVVTSVRLVSEQVHLSSTSHSDVVADSSKVEMMLVGLSGSLDCSIKVWNLDSGGLVRSIYVFSPITCMDYCDNKIVIGTEGGKVDVWDLSAGRHLYTARNPDRAVTCVKVHNGNIFCADKSVQKLRMDPHSPTSPLLNTAHMIPHKYFNTIRCMCIHGNNIYWGDNGVDLKVFNSITGELIKYRTHPGKNVCTGAVDIVDDIIMCAGYDVDQGVAYINIHSLQDNSYVCTLSDNSSEYITCMACLEGVVTPDSYTTSLVGVTRIITGGNNAELKVWDLASVDDQTSLKSYQQLVTPSPSFSPAYGQSSCDTESSEDHDDGIQDDDINDAGLHSHPLPIPRPKPADQPESQMWQWCLLF